MESVGGGVNVAVADDRNTDGSLDGSNLLQGYAGAVHLLAGATVDANGVRAAVLQNFGHFHGVDMGGVKADADLDGDGDADGSLDGAHQLSGKCGIFEQRAALAVTDDLGHGAAHVQINGGGRGLALAAGVRAVLDHFGGLGQEMRITTEQLNRHRDVVGGHASQRRGAGIFAYRRALAHALIAKRLCRDHLADGIFCAETAANGAERVVADPG